MIERNSRENQQRVLQFVRRYIESNQQSPTIREIADFVGYSSVSGTHKALQGLERRGLIRRNRKRAWRDLVIVDQIEVARKDNVISRGQAA